VGSGKHLQTTVREKNSRMGESKKWQSQFGGVKRKKTHAPGLTERGGPAMEREGKQRLERVTRGKTLRLKKEEISTRGVGPPLSKCHHLGPIG